MTAATRALLVLGEAAEVAACELLAAALDETRAVHADVVRAVAGLPCDLSALPCDVAAVLAGLRQMGDWRPARIRHRVLERCPLVAGARVSYDCAACVRTICTFTRQVEAEHLLSAFCSALIHEGADHPETLSRAHACVALLECPQSVTAQRDRRAVA